MKKILSTILFVCIIILSSVYSHAEDSLKTLFEQFRPAIVTVISYDSHRNPIQQGTGFFINDKGHLITNYHVLEDAYTADIEFKKGNTYRVDRILAENQSADIVKAKIDIPQNTFKWIKITREVPSTAERIVVIGSPMGLEHSISDGIVSAIRDFPDFGKIYQVSAPISPGSSGSPVINMKGEVIGIATFQFIKGQNLNFAIPAGYILTMKDFKRPKIVSDWSYGTDEKPDKKRSLKEIMKSAGPPEEKETEYIIHFNNGKKLKLKEYWEEGGLIKCNRFGTVVGYAKNQIIHIEKKEVVKKKDDKLIVDFYKPKTAKHNIKSKYGLYKIWYNINKWRLKHRNHTKDAEVKFAHSSMDVFASVFSGSGFSSYNDMVEQIITSVSNSGGRILYQDKRMVNGKEVYFVRTEEDISGTPAILCNYYWTGRSGNIRFVIFTEEYNFDKYEKDIMSLLNGLVIRKQ